MAYGYIGSLKAKPGQRDELVSLLLDGVETSKKAGCNLSVISRSESDEDTVWVTEVWDSKEQHQASLELPEAKAAIEKSQGLLTGDFTTQELSVAGGVGL